MVNSYMTRNELLKLKNFLEIQIAILKHDLEAFAYGVPCSGSTSKIEEELTSYENGLKEVLKRLG